jgi:hypothetical protein
MAKAVKKAVKKLRFAIICANRPIALGVNAALDEIGVSCDYDEDQLDDGVVMTGITGDRGLGYRERNGKVLVNEIVLDASRDLGLIIREVDSWQSDGGSASVIAAEDFDTHGKSYLYPGGGIKVGCKEFTREEADKVVVLIRAGKEVEYQTIGSHRVGISDHNLCVGSEYIPLTEAKQIADWRDHNLARVVKALNVQHHRALEEANRRNRVALAVALAAKKARK